MRGRTGRVTLTSVSISFKFGADSDVVMCSSAASPHLSAARS